MSAIKGEHAAIASAEVLRKSLQQRNEQISDDADVY